MSQPGLHILLEVEVLQRVELTSASCHDVTVSRDRICHVEIADVFNQVGAVEMSLPVWPVGVVFKARRLNKVILDQVSDSCWCQIDLWQHFITMASVGESRAFRRLVSLIKDLEHVLVRLLEA